MDKNGEKNKKNYKPTFGQKTADSVAKLVGSWKFIIGQTIFLLAWITVNILALSWHWDPYPFIFLNLIVGFQAAYTAPLIMMSENRSAERDRKKFEIDLATDRKAEREIEEIQIKLEKIDREKLDKILKILEQNNNS